MVLGNFFVIFVLVINGSTHLNQLGIFFALKLAHLIAQIEALHHFLGTFLHFANFFGHGVQYIVDNTHWRLSI